MGPILRSTTEATVSGSSVESTLQLLDAQEPVTVASEYPHSTLNGTPRNWSGGIWMCIEWVIILVNSTGFEAMKPSQMHDKVDYILRLMLWVQPDIKSHIKEQPFCFFSKLYTFSSIRKPV